MQKSYAALLTRPNFDTRRGETACSGCGRLLLSAYSATGSCHTCGAPLCVYCRGMGTQHCREHAPKVVENRVEAANAATAPPQRVERPRLTWAAHQKNGCKRCGEALPQRPGHRRPLYCLPCQETLSRPPTALPAGTLDVVSACYLEHLFFDRVSRHTPTQDVPGWDTLDPRLLETHACADALRGRVPGLPANRVARAHRELGLWSWWRGGRRVFTFAACADRNALLERGFQRGTAGPALVQRARTALTTGTKGEPALVLFSPTGWQEGIPLPSDTALVWLGSDGTWKVRHSLSRTEDAAWLEICFAPGDTREELARCLAHIRTAPAGNFPLSALRLARGLGISETAAREAFHEAAREETWHLCEDPQRHDLLLDLR